MTQQDLFNILVQIRNDALDIQRGPTEANLQALIQKYDMVFYGEKFNNILSIDLAHMLNSKMGVNVSLDELHTLLPAVCTALNLKTDPLIKASDAGLQNPPTYCYSISLF